MPESTVLLHKEFPLARADRCDACQTLAVWSPYFYPLLADGRGSTSGSNILSNINNYQLSDVCVRCCFRLFHWFCSEANWNSSPLFYYLYLKYYLSDGTKYISAQRKFLMKNRQHREPRCLYSKVFNDTVCCVCGGFAAGFFLGCRF